MKSTVKSLSDQALKAMNALLILFKRIFDVQPKRMLFYRMAVQILLYGYEIFGIYQFKDLEKCT